MITPDQCRAARILLKLSAPDLASAAAVGIATVKRFESGQSVQTSTIRAIMDALTEAGIIFIAVGETSSEGGEGVRLTLKPE